MLKSSLTRLADSTRETQLFWSMGPSTCVVARRLDARGPAEDRMCRMEATREGLGGNDGGRADDTT
jgi:hypothetical protein